MTATQDSRRVVVTGARGKLGRAVVTHLREVGIEVLAVDRVAGGDPREVDGEFLMADLTDYGQVVELLTGAVDEHGPVDAVVHLAAIPAPGMTPNAVTYANNSAATYNVFAAARGAGVRTIVWASSETVLGIPFDTPPPYAPVDEEYPPRPESTYSLNKALEEELARHFCRWQPDLVAVGLRFSNVMDVADYAEFPSFDADPRQRKWNLWGYIDARDGASAVERALQHDVPGADVFVIANADTVMSRSSASLMAEVYPDVPVTKELGRARDPALDRQGAAGPGLRATPLLARPRGLSPGKASLGSEHEGQRLSVRPQPRSPSVGPPRPSAELTQPSSDRFGAGIVDPAADAALRSGEVLQPCRAPAAPRTPGGAGGERRGRSRTGAWCQPAMYGRRLLRRPTTGSTGRSGRSRSR